MLVVVFFWLLDGFGAVLRVFWITLLFILVPDAKNSQNGSKSTQKPRKDDNEQLKYDLAVLFSLKFIFNPEECVTYGYNFAHKVHVLYLTLQGFDRAQYMKEAVMLIKY